MRIIVDVGFYCSLAAMVMFLGVAAFDSAYGFYLCQSTGNWFSADGNRYVFDYADTNLLKGGIAFIVWIPFTFFH